MIPDEKRSEGPPLVRGVSVSADDEFLPAAGTWPSTSPASGRRGMAAPRRLHIRAFQPSLAALLIEPAAPALNVLQVLHVGIPPRRQDFGQQPLAVLQGGRAKIVAVEIEQIENGIRQAAVVVLAHFVLQGLEARSPIRQEDGNFAVQNGLADRQLAGGRGHSRKTIAPIPVRARKQRGLSSGDVADDAVTVELDFADPAIAFGRVPGQGRQFQFDAFRHGGALCRGMRATVPAVRRFLPGVAIAESASFVAVGGLPRFLQNRRGGGLLDGAARWRRSPVVLARTSN